MREGLSGGGEGTLTSRLPQASIFIDRGMLRLGLFLRQPQHLRRPAAGRGAGLWPAVTSRLRADRGQGKFSENSITQVCPRRRNIR